MHNREPEEGAKFDRRHGTQDFILRAFEAINRSFDLLAQTLSATQEIQRTQQKQIGDNAAEIRSIQESIKGRDEGINHIPGLRDILNQHIHRDEELIRTGKFVLRWVVLPVAVVLLIVPFLHALGLPTTIVGKALGFPVTGN